MLRDVLVEEIHPATSVGSWINQASGFGDGLFTDVATPIIDDNLPGRTVGDLFQDIGDEDARPHECGLSVTDRRIGDDVSAECFRHPATSLICFPFQVSDV